MSETQDILVVGESILPSTTKRISVKVTSNGRTLVIEDVEEDDYGHYQCKVAVQGEEAPQIVHTVRILSVYLFYEWLFRASSKTSKH